MNANCLSCFATVPYVNGQRPKFCGSCGKSMSIGLSVDIGSSISGSKKIKSRATEDDEDEFEFSEPADQLKISIRTEGVSDKAPVTLGALASMPEAAFFNGSRPKFEGDPLQAVSDTIKAGAQEINE